jgi:RHS repeat-associated protein
VRTVTEPNGGSVVRYEQYNRVGNLERVVKANGVVLQLTYDTAHRRTSVTGQVVGQFDQQSISIGYAGTRTSVLTDSASGTSLGYGYDAAGRVASIQGPGSTVTYTYDGGTSRVRTVQYGGGRTLTYGYDAGRMRTLTSSNGGGVTYEYQHPTNKTLLTRVLRSGSAATTVLEYDAGQRLRKITRQGLNQPGNQPWSRVYEYTLDQNGNKLTMTEQHDGTPVAGRTYTYTELDQLATEGEGATVTAYDYDKAGNRIFERSGAGGPVQATYEYHPTMNWLTAVTRGGEVTQYGFDLSGNQTSRTRAGATRTFTYDAFDRLTRVQESGVTLGQYSYAADGLRTTKTLPTQPGQPFTYTWDRSGLGKVLSNGQGDHYGWGADGLATWNKPTAQPPSTAYVHGDAAGSTRVISNSSGGILGTQQYDAFGRRVESGFSGESSLEFGYQGEQRDAETGLTYLRARYLDPDTGRFLTPDPLPGSLTDPSSQHPYAYVGNNPLSVTDSARTHRP